MGSQETVEKPVEIADGSEVSPTKLSIYSSLHRKWDKRAIVENRQLRTAEEAFF